MLRRPSLQKRLLVIFSALGVVLVGLSMFLSAIFGQSFKQDISERNLRLAASIAGQIELSLDHHSNELLQLSLEVTRKGATNTLVHGIMQRILDYHPLITTMCLLDKEGSVLTVVPDNPEIRGLNMSRQPYYQPAAAVPGRIYWSSSYVSSGMDRKTITISIAFTEVMLVAHLDLDVLSEIVRSKNPVTEGFITLIDAGGNSITDTVQEMGTGHVNYMEFASIKKAFDGNDGSYEEQIGGVSGLSSTYLIREMGWVVLVFQPKIGTYGLVDRLIYITSMILIMALVGALLISLGLLKKIMNPVRNMVRQTRSVAAGGYNVSVMVEYAEFEELGESFNLMARSIEAREDDIKRSEIRYKELFENNPLPVIIFDADDLNILDVSQAAAEDYGYTRNEFLGMSVLDIRPVEDISTLKSSLSNRPSGRDKAGVFRHLKKDGTVFYVEVTSHEIIFLGKKAILAICRDVTSQVLIEEALRESQEKLRATLESIGDAIIIIDPELNVTWANRFARNNIGYFVDVKCHFAVHGTSEPCADCAALRSLKDEKTYHTEERVMDPDGLTRTYYVSTAPMYDNLGNVTGVVKSLKDITETKRSESLLLQSLAEKEILLKEIHHRVKNNLQAISGIIDMQSNYTSELWTKKILQDSQNRILSMALIHEKLYEMGELNRIDFGDYISSLVKHLASIYDVKNKGIEFDVSYDRVLLNVDTALPCGLMISELVSNSFKHAFPNNEMGKINLELRKKGVDQFVIAIGDNGIGMGDDFEITTNNSLGFNLVRSYVELLAGTLEVSVKDGLQLRITFREYQECPITEL